MTDIYDVSLEHAESYDEEGRLAEILEKAISSVGGFDFITDGMTVGIKANLVSAMKPERAGTTDPRMIRALCGLLLARGVSKIIIGDSPGGLYTPVFLSFVYSATGMKGLENDRILCNSDFSTKQMSFPGGKVMKTFLGTDWLHGVDAIINFSKLKTHGMMGMSAAVKNLYGTIPGTVKAEFHSLYHEHSSFADMLIDLNEYWKPSLCICDAVVGMEGNGPTAGTPRHIGAVLVSKSPYALDAVAAKIIGLSPDFVPTVANSIERGLLRRDMNELRITNPVGEFVIKDYKNIAEKKNIGFDNFGETAFKHTIYRIGGFLTRTKPMPDKKQCIGCGKCAEVCPEKAIGIVGRRARIDRKHCIRCFCCQEFCPVGAMKVKRSFVGRMLVK